MVRTRDDYKCTYLYRQVGALIHRRYSHKQGVCNTQAININTVEIRKRESDIYYTMPLQQVSVKWSHYGSKMNRLIWETYIPTYYKIDRPL